MWESMRSLDYGPAGRDPTWTLLSAAGNQTLHRKVQNVREEPTLRTKTQLAASAPSLVLPRVFREAPRAIPSDRELTFNEFFEGRTGENTRSVDDVMGNVTAVKYRDLRTFCTTGPKFNDPSVHKRTLMQATVLLNAANTMMPDPKAPNSLLPPPLDAIWATLPEVLRPNVEKVLR